MSAESDSAFNAGILTGRIDAIEKRMDRDAEKMEAWLKSVEGKLDAVQATVTSARGGLITGRWIVATIAAGVSAVWVVLAAVGNIFGIHVTWTK